MRAAYSTFPLCHPQLRTVSEASLDTPQSIIEAAGFVYRGAQKNRAGETLYHLFDDSLTGSTLATEGEITVESIHAKVQKSRSGFSRAK